MVTVGAGEKFRALIMMKGGALSRFKYSAVIMMAVGAGEKIQCTDHSYTDLWFMKQL